MTAVGDNIRLATITTIALMIFVTFTVFTTVMADDLCRVFSNGTKIRDPESCNAYIECIDFVSHHHECPKSTPYFNKATEKCVKTLPVDSSCYISCDNSTGRFITDPKSCLGYYYCIDESTPLQGECPTGTHFNETQQACITRDNSVCRVGTLNFCSVIKDGINFNDESSCERYFVCTKGVLTPKICKDMYFDAATGKCVSKSIVACIEHPVPSKTCGTDAKPEFDKFKSDGATCSGYFFCAKKTIGNDTAPVWGQCPIDTFFDEKRQMCVDPTEVKCKEDRCVNRSQMFVSAATKGCQQYLICQDGIAVSTHNCDGNNFFDEHLGACVNKIVKYPSCS